MQPFRKPGITPPCTRKQQGAALMVMLVIMILGASAILVSSLASSAIQIERDKTTVNALAQAKEALIGYAVSDFNHPGSLPCPDVDDDGMLKVGGADFNGSTCASLVGRLPWKTLRLPELRDGAGEHLWYAVSKPFAAVGSPSINSDTLGTLSISGTSPASQVIAIVFAPGQIVNDSSRSPSTTAACLTSGTTVVQSWCATNYLEGSNAALSTWAAPNLSFQSADISSTFNDRMIFITHKNLMPLIEKRIAREAKGCLDNYASNSASEYPWAVPVSDTAYYTSTTNILFGRLPTTISNPSSVVQQLLDFLAALQTALTNYNLSNNYSDQTYIDALMTAGANLADYASTQTPASAAPLDQTSLDLAYIAGTFVKAPEPQTTWTNNQAAEFVKALQKRINLTNNNFNSKNHDKIPNTIFIIGWPNCKLFYSSYWADWKNLVFYQIAEGYAPGGAGSCTTNITTNDSDSASCISITGTGNTVGGNGTYHAAVVVAGKNLPNNPARTPSSITNYLESAQANRASTIASPTPSSRIFNTYKTFDANYQTANDLALCLDGSNNCK